MTIPLHPGPGAGFEQPVEMLEACHERVLQRVALLERLDRHLQAHGSDDQAIEAAQDLIRYFDIAAVHHHEDEERHLLPLLRRIGEAPLADEVLAAHALLARLWVPIRDELRRVAAGQPLQGAPAERGARWGDYARHYRAHVELEEARLFPLAERLTGAERAEMGADMARRRGVR